jgi:hypothetical protein
MTYLYFAKHEFLITTIMKSFVFSIILTFWGFELLAQVKTHIDSVNYSWKAHQMLTESHKPNLLTFDFSDTLGIPFSKFWTQSGNDSLAGIYFYSWDATEKALNIHFNYSNRTKSNTNALLSYDWSKHQQSGSSFNPFLYSLDSVEGVFLDISAADAAKLVLNYRTVGLSDSAQVRFDLSDGNGRQTNWVSPKHTLKPSTSYQDVTFSWAESSNGNNEWNQDVSEAMDAWSTSWFGIDNGRTVGITGKPLANGLPGIGKGGVDIIPVDLSSICKFTMYINEKDIALSGIDTNFSIFIKSITIGDKLASTDDQIVFGHQNICSCCHYPWDTVSTKIVPNDLEIKIYPNPSKEFIKIETKATISQIEIINSVGIVVSQMTGQSHISVSNLDKGIYTVRATTNGYMALTGGFVKE